MTKVRGPEAGRNSTHQERGQRPGGSTKRYRVTTRGPVPGDLPQRVAALHSKAILIVETQAARERK